MIDLDILKVKSGSYWSRANGSIQILLPVAVRSVDVIGLAQVQPVMSGHHETQFGLGILNSGIYVGVSLSMDWPGAQGVIWKYGNHGLEGLESGRFSLTVSIIIHI